MNITLSEVFRSRTGRRLPLGARIAAVPLAAASVGLLPSTLRADEITDWNQILCQAGHAANNTSSVITSRSAAIVGASVFDAVNGIGIKGRYQPIHVEWRKA
jgi:hypothetical protein